MPENRENPPFRTKSVSVPIARSSASGSAGNSATVKCLIQLPSRRLSCAFSVSFEPDSSQRVASYAVAPTWTATALRRNPVSNKVGTLHSIFSGRSLPELYEVDTAVRLIELSVLVTVAQDGAAATIPGVWVLLVEWEPNQDMASCPGEEAQLFGLCDAKGPDSTAIPHLGP